ncbi:MAG: hypothetical protein KGQ41_05425 [Alphaproteobacteria bacterium]|nr:hypothetical protein [Alphaproteobacteria bacterium]
MGSFFTRPTPPPTVTYTAPVQQTPSQPAVPAVPSTGAVSNDAEKVVATIQKRRSVPQTIQTSYRGVLAQADFVPARKNLLGE